MGNLMDYLSPFLLYTFIFVNLTVRTGLSETPPPPQNGSNKPINASVSSNNEVRVNSSHSQSRGQPSSQNPEGELHVPKSSRKRKTAKSTTASQESVATRPRKGKTQSIAKAKKSSKKAKHRDSEEEDFLKSLELEGDEDIHRIVTARTSTFVDDYEWSADADWDNFVENTDNRSRIFNFHSDESEASQNEQRKVTKPPHRVQSKTRKSTSRKSTSHRDSRERTSRATKKQKASKVTSTTRAKSEPGPRGFDDSESELETPKELSTVVKGRPKLRDLEDSVSEAVVAGSDESLLYESQDTLLAECDEENYSITYMDLDDETNEEDVEYDAEEGESDYKDTSSEDYSSDSDYSATKESEYDDYEIVHDKSEAVKSAESTDRRPLTGLTGLSKKLKRKMALKKKKNWIKQDKRERKSRKQRNRKKSIDGERKNKGAYEPKRRRSGDIDNRSRATRLGIRRKLDGRDYGRNAGKKVFYRNKKRFFRGPKRRFPLRGKAKDNVRVNRQPGKPKRGQRSPARRQNGPRSINSVRGRRTNR